MLLRDPAYARGGVVPPLLVQQEALVDEIVWPALPRLAYEAPILRQGRNAGLGSATHRTLTEMMSKPRGLSQRLLNKLHLLAR